jgi:DNA (cytosine-5)-methyltransferase 1
LLGHLASGGKKRKSPAADAGGGVEAGGLIGGIDYEHNAHGPNDVTGPLLKGSPTGGGHPLPAIAYRKAKRAQSTTDDETWVEGQVSNTLNNFDLGDTRTTHAVVEPLAWTQNQREEVRLLGDKVGAIALPGTHQTNYIAEPVHQMPACANPMAVRRLTPVECERLQGFPDNWSRISWKGKPETDCPDGPRYKACGNSMAVPVMRWIGEQIKAYESNRQ